jgi:4-carboxymuconolactone decarboxylase
MMGEYLPQVYERFGMEYPDVMDAYRNLAERLHEAGPLSARERRLAKLGIAAGRESEGGVRSHARKALAEGIEAEAIRQVAVLAISTAGYPAAMAAYGWINEVMKAES